MPGSPWENAFIESCNTRLRDELRNGEVFYSLAEARIVIENWHRDDNTVRRHGSLGFKPPAPEIFIPMAPAWVPAHPPPSAPTRTPTPTLNERSTWTPHWGPIAGPDRKIVR